MVEMNEELEDFMNEELNVTAEDVEAMDDNELDDLYERACALEEVIAIDCDGDDENEDLQKAAAIVDWLHGPYTEWED